MVAVCGLWCSLLLLSMNIRSKSTVHGLNSFDQESQEISAMVHGPLVLCIGYITRLCECESRRTNLHLMIRLACTMARKEQSMALGKKLFG